MRAFVDPDLCIGCTQCAGICPAGFTMAAVDAAQACPVSAIRMEES